LAGEGYSQKALRTGKAGYVSGSITHLDHQIGPDSASPGTMRMLLNNTVILFTSDPRGYDGTMTGSMNPYAYEGSALNSL